MIEILKEIVAFILVMIVAYIGFCIAVGIVKGVKGVFDDKH